MGLAYKAVTSTNRGQKFEDFTREVIFPNDRYKLLKKTHDYAQNKSDYVTDSLEPDFKFECIETKRQFYVEAKFRSWLYDNGKGSKIDFCKISQYKRLHTLNKIDPVFILIGLENEPDYPEYVLLIPMSDITSTELTKNFLDDYDIANNVSISPKKLWSLISNTAKGSVKETKSDKNIKEKVVKTSGYCIRCNDALKFDITHPFCKPCYQEWNKYKNPEYKELYCHKCGQKHSVTFIKPVCYSCYTKGV
jgi:hypothetical protein